jgi:hypothetical protein
VVGKNRVLWGLPKTAFSGIPVGFNFHEIDAFSELGCSCKWVYLSPDYR